MPSTAFPREARLSGTARVKELQERSVDSTRTLLSIGLRAFMTSIRWNHASSDCAGFSQSELSGSLETAHLYWMAIAWSLDRIGMPVRLAAEVVAGVARLTEFIITPTKDAIVAS